MKIVSTLAIVFTSLVVFTPVAHAGAGSANTLVRCLQTKLGFVSGVDFRVNRTGGRRRAGVKIGGRTKVQLANAVRRSPALMRKVRNQCPK